ncbi:alpha-hydroxy-acid oxidizing protein [Nostocoides sp. Soil756]|uniref:alpha-hydroxy-acid oxidizing protein n=1 Tax=Nostocoides sp. Soil756 TaxID=1736399 RepID=UPI0007021B65|nr:alpha-hydroxy-acid oxidizing protein [Tetrasphaera sp. Soil756]KRE61315.1 lactate 2-monooxygenase [Tetrasphaera sp. Soil756]
MAATDIGRLVQGAIYRAGSFGHRPAVPTDGRLLEAAAEQVMSRRAFAYVAGAAGSEASARANRDAFDRWRVLPRMLVDTRERDLSVELLGRRHPAPLLLSPVGVLSSAHPEADLAAARAAAGEGVTPVLSTQASVPMEDVAAAVRGAGHWYQLYWSNDDDLAASLVHRAEACGSEALVVTLDTAYLGWRPRDLDLGHLPFARGEGIAQYTSDPVFRRLVQERVDAAGGRPAEPSPRPTPAAVRTLLSMSRNHPGPTRENLTSPVPRAAVETFLDVFSRPGLTWADLPRLRAMTSLPIVLKGVLHPQDAQRAVDAGVDGVWVSNHGGRQVDRSVGALDALPGVVDAVRGRGSAMPVLFDSGVRTGADVFVALALGATAVGIGRPYVYGLALAGQEGAAQVLRHLVAELDLTMALTGCRTLADLTRDRLVAAPAS